MAGLRDLDVDGGVVPAECLSVRFARSGGPGGQNVNKVASKVDLRLDLAAAVEHLGEDRVERVRSALAARIDAAGRLFVVCDEHRSQARNLETALDRIEKLLRAALQRRKRRRPTRPTRASRERRLSDKRRRSDIKRGRRGGED